MKKSSLKNILNKSAILLFAFSLCSCSRHFTENRQITDFSTLQSHIQKRQNTLTFHNLKIKFKTTFNDNGKEQKLTGKILTYSDTCIYINLISSTFGIEVGQIHLKTDSLIFINKIDETYFSGSYSDLRRYLNINFQSIYSFLTNTYLGPNQVSFNSDNCSLVPDFQRFIVNDKYDVENNSRFVTSQFDNYGNLERTESKSMDGSFLRFNYSNFVLDYAFPKQMTFTTYVKYEKINATSLKSQIVNEKFEQTLLIESVEILKKSENNYSAPSLKNYKFEKL